MSARQKWWGYVAVINSLNAKIHLGAIEIRLHSFKHSVVIRVTLFRCVRAYERYLGGRLFLYADKKCIVCRDLYGATTDLLPPYEQL